MRSIKSNMAAFRFTMANSRVLKRSCTSIDVAERYCSQNWALWLIGWHDDWL